MKTFRTVNIEQFLAVTHKSLGQRNVCGLSFFIVIFYNVCFVLKIAYMCSHFMCVDIVKMLSFDLEEWNIKYFDGTQCFFFLSFSVLISVNLLFDETSQPAH